MTYWTETKGTITDYDNWVDWVDALFALGITNPGHEGFQSPDPENPRVQWGRKP